MLYLVGGCSRSGKSILAGRVATRRGVPWFPLDALKMGLHLGAPALGIHPADEDLATAGRLWPIVAGLLDHLVFEGRDYLVEGVNLRPATVADYIADTDTPVRACFLGYPDVDLAAKAAEVARHPGPPTDWLHRTGPATVRRTLAANRALSRALRDECAATGIPFIDTGIAFTTALADAERALFGD